MNSCARDDSACCAPPSTCAAPEHTRRHEQRSCFRPLERRRGGSPPSLCIVKAPSEIHCLKRQQWQVHPQYKNKRGGSTDSRQRKESHNQSPGFQLWYVGLWYVEGESCIDGCLIGVSWGRSSICYSVGCSPSGQPQRFLLSKANLILM